MKTRKFFLGKAIGTLLLFTAIALVATFFAIATSKFRAQYSRLTALEPYRATLSGMYLCIPRIDSNLDAGCVSGLQSEDGMYYAIDFGPMSQMIPQLHEGDWITGSGMITPIERLSTDHWRQYKVAAIFSVTDSLHAIPQTNRVI